MDDIRAADLAASMFNTPGFADQVEHFGEILTPGDIHAIASALFRIALEKEPVCRDQESCPGFVQLWRLWLGQEIPKPEEIVIHDNWLLTELEISMPLSLRFANDIYYYWRRHNRGEIGSNPQDEIRKSFVKLAQRIYTSESAFATALDPDFPYSSYHFAILYSEDKEGGTGFKAEEWQWFGALLANSARLYPDIVIPQIVVMVVKEDKGFRASKSTHEFDFELTQRLFGPLYDELLLLLSNGFNTSRFHGNELERIEFAQSSARKALP